MGRVGYPAISFSKLPYPRPRYKSKSTSSKLFWEKKLSKLFCTKYVVQNNLLTYRMIPVFNWNDHSGIRQESFWLSVSKQHNSNILLERWYHQQHLGILQLALALALCYKWQIKGCVNPNVKFLKLPTQYFFLSM